MTLLAKKQRLLKFLHRAVICAAVAIVAAVVLELLQVTSQPKQVTSQPNTNTVYRGEGSGITSMNLDLALLAMCAHHNGSVVVAGIPAQISFALDGPQTIDKVMVSTDQIDGPYVVRVLYNAEGE